jgi:hypothetical protein
MRNALKVRLPGPAAALLISAAFSGVAMADLRVIESTVPAVAAGASFPDGAVFDVPKGKKIKFLKTPANSTHEIEGPYNGTLGAYEPACSWIDWASGKCSRSGDREGATPGGTRSAPVPGATRGLSRQQPAQPNE